MTRGWRETRVITAESTRDRVVDTVPGGEGSGRVSQAIAGSLQAILPFKLKCSGFTILC